MRLFRTEVKLVSCDGFGPISSTQKPNRIVRLDEGWQAIGVMSVYGSNWIVAQRRRWFWMKDRASCSAQRAGMSRFEQDEMRRYGRPITSGSGDRPPPPRS